MFCLNYKNIHCLPTGRGNSFIKNPFSIKPVEVTVPAGEGAEDKGLFVPLKLFTVVGELTLNNPFMT